MTKAQAKYNIALVRHKNKQKHKLGRSSFPTVLSCQNNCYTKWIVERVETLHKQKRVKQNLEETLGVTTITRQKTTDNKVAHRSNVKIHVQERRHARRFRLWLCFGFMFGFTRGFALYVLFQGRFETRNKYIRHGPIDG